MVTLLRKPLTRRRMWAALIIAVAADALQLIPGAVLPFFDEAIDVAAMCALTFLVGFHPLFLPTFIVEFLPGVDLLPTWTGCLAVVVALSRKQQKTTPAPPPDVIDI